MAILRKNIWTLFYILFTGSLLFLGIATYYKWHDVHAKYLTTQTNLVKLVSNAAHSLFISQEMMLGILGNEVLNDKDHRILDDLLKLNPSIVGFGFSDPEGHLLYVTSNMNKSKLPNLKTQPSSRDSFLYALSQDKMVLGRTYFMKALDDWVIPIRRTVTSDDGKILAMMTAGLHIRGAFKLFMDNLYIGEYNKVSLLRSRDLFIQYQSSNQKVTDDLYATPLPEALYHTILKKISQKYSLSEEAIKNSGHFYDVEATTGNGKVSQIVMKYDPRFELWTLSEIDHEYIQADFFNTLLWYVFIFLSVQGVVFALFRLIANAENERREDLVFQATHDPLTLLPNRSFLQHHISDWIYEGAPPFSLYYIDMDHFKNVNDSFGHQFGDHVLVELSKRLGTMIRKDSIIIRQGGDEFIILSYRTNKEELLTHAKTLIHKISQPYHVNQFSFVIGASIGIATYPEHGETLDMLLRAADIAMYESKKHKNSVHIFAPTMQEGYLNKVTIEQALRKALDDETLFMVYQPQIDQSNTIYGVEALVRWNDPDLGFIPPDQFIGIAEASGLMPRLGHFILNASLQEMKALQEVLGVSFQTSINISVKQFMEANFLKKLSEEIEKAHLSSVSICLEITENLFIEDVEYILPLLQKIHAMGLHISMDDFGTGYSSLGMLRSLPIDELKIDKSFVDTILNDETAKKMIQNIIAIGKNLELKVLAEGVETKEQAEILKSFGCDRFQGYYYAKPMVANALKDFFITHNQLQ